MSGRPLSSNLRANQASTPLARHRGTSIAPLVAVALAAIAWSCTTTVPRRQVIVPEGAPRAGAYSPAVRVGETLYVAGQIPIDPATGQLVPGGIEAQTKQALDNVKRIVEAAGFSMTDVVSVTVYLVSIDEFAAMNQVYAGYFPSAPPARATVAVASLVRNARIEISAIAAR